MAQTPWRDHAGFHLESLGGGTSFLLSASSGRECRGGARALWIESVGGYWGIVWNLFSTMTTVRFTSSHCNALAAKFNEQKVSTRKETGI